ncbi:DUF6867 family protein [Aureimonas sp. AU12]|jgi:hypothetical protein|uniref:DUF6867 family protein n=1 Tax=Aureimonas sp. AU12 TaxID=1638161 RepID=UPI0007859185|nr:hypothetical protein [Aureimonas sp. AU12]
MTPDMALLWEVSWVEFLVVTLVIGGALAYAVGRATALGWSGWGLMVLYTLLLTVAIRFLHFSLFNGSFFLPVSTLPTALHYGLVDFVILFGVAVVGRLATRSQQVSRQYGFLRPNAGHKA